MTAAANKYACLFVADRRAVSILEVSATESERSLAVTIGAGASCSWQIKLPLWYFPSIAILPGSAIAVWAVTRLYYLRDGSEPVCADFVDEIHAVYAVDGGLCIVGELSVFIYDLKRAEVVDRFDAEDVLGNSWWEGDHLFVESTSGAPLGFNPRGGKVRHVAVR